MWHLVRVPPHVCKKLAVKLLLQKIVWKGKYMALCSWVCHPLASFLLVIGVLEMELPNEKCVLLRGWFNKHTSSRCQLNHCRAALIWLNSIKTLKLNWHLNCLIKQNRSQSVLLLFPWDSTRTFSPLNQNKWEQFAWSPHVWIIWGPPPLIWS